MCSISSSTRFLVSLYPIFDAGEQAGNLWNRRHFAILLMMTAQLAVDQHDPPRRSAAGALDAAPCVRPVAARLGSASMGALDEEHGSIRSKVQRARCRAIVAAGEFAGGSGLRDGWDQCHNTGALAG
jgi:hypothetical protein